MRNLSGKKNLFHHNKKDKKYERVCAVMFATGITTGFTLLINLLLNY